MIVDKLILFDDLEINFRFWGLLKNDWPQINNRTTIQYKKNDIIELDRTKFEPEIKKTKYRDFEPGFLNYMKRISAAIINSEDLMHDAMQIEIPEPKTEFLKMKEFKVFFNMEYHILICVYDHMTDTLFILGN